MCWLFPDGVVCDRATLDHWSLADQGGRVSRRKPLPADLAGEAFLAGTAIAAGLGWGVLRGPSVSRVSRGLYLDGSAPRTPRSHLAAYLRVLPHGRTAVDGVSALQLWGVDVGTPLPIATSRQPSITPSAQTSASAGPTRCRVV